MIGVEVKFSAKQQQKILQATEKAKQGKLTAGGFLISTYAKESVKQRKDPKTSASPGQPSYQHNRGYRAAIAYVYTHSPQDVLIGFRYSMAGVTPGIHEHGLMQNGRDYPERPTMLPALERNIERFHKDWRSSI